MFGGVAGVESKIQNPNQHNMTLAMKIYLMQMNYCADILSVHKTGPEFRKNLKSSLLTYKLGGSGKLNICNTFSKQLSLGLNYLHF